MSIDLLGEIFFSDSSDNLHSHLTQWYGRVLSCEDLPELEEDVKRRISWILSEGDFQSKLLSFKLALIGSSEEKRPLIERDITHLMQLSDGWQIEQVGLRKSFRNAGEKVARGCSQAWDKTCEVTQRTCASVQEFWVDHKKEILIGTAVVTAAVAITAIIVYSGGTGAQAAIATAATAIDHLSNKPSSDRKNPLKTDPIEIPTPPELSLPTSSYEPVELKTEKDDFLIAAPVALNLAPNKTDLPPSLNPFDTRVKYETPSRMPVQTPYSFRSNFPLEYRPFASSRYSDYLDLQKYKAVEPKALSNYEPQIANLFPHETYKGLNLNANSTISFIENPSNQTPLSSRIKDFTLQFLEITGRGMIDRDLQDPNVPLPIADPLFAASIHTTKNFAYDFLETIGRQMLSRTLQDPNIPLPSAPLSSHYFTDGRKLSNLKIGGINGMNTTFDEMKSNAQYLNKFIPENSIEWVYNNTHGVAGDIVEIFAGNYAGLSPNTSNLLLENWTNFHNENANNPDAKYLQFCHSQGAIHTVNTLKEASKEIRDRIIVVAIAPAKIVPRELCFRSFNYASQKDIVPYGELLHAALVDIGHSGLTGAFARALQARQQLVLLEPHEGAEGIDHGWQSLTFSESIERHLKIHFECQGEYK